MPNVLTTDKSYIRRLTLEEARTLHTFPEGYDFAGGKSATYRQIGNAVPVGLGEAVGRAVLAHMAGQDAQPPANFPFSRYKGTDEVSWEQNTRTAMGLDTGLK